MPIKSYKMGPGTLVLGEAGSPHDFSAQVTAARISWAMERGDATPVLTGEELPGDIEWSASLSVTFLQDLAVNGVVDYSWTNKGTDVPFTFVPSTADAREVTGTVTLMPLDIGGDAKARPTSDVEWPCVGEPTFGAV